MSAPCQPALRFCWQSVQIPGGQRVLVQAEIVPELVQIGAAHFLVEARSFFFSLLENVLQIKNNLRGRARIMHVFVAGCADK